MSDRDQARESGSLEVPHHLTEPEPRDLRTSGWTRLPWRTLSRTLSLTLLECNLEVLALEGVGGEWLRLDRGSTSSGLELSCTATLETTPGAGAVWTPSSLSFSTRWMERVHLHWQRRTFSKFLQLKLARNKWKRVNRVQCVGRSVSRRIILFFHILMFRISVKERR